MRVAVASLLQETNTFSPRLTRLEDFLLIPAPELIASHRTENSELHGFIDALEQGKCEIVPLLGGWAVTAGRITASALRSLVSDLIDGIKTSGKLDGVLLALHGAWAGEGVDSCDGYILQEVRKTVGPDVPIVVTFDLHASLASSIWNSADVIVGYHTCPHTDLYETGLHAGRILTATIRGEIRPVMSVVRIPMVVQAENMTSNRGEFAEMIESAEALERQPGVLSASVFAAQPWLDVEELGWASVVITDNDKDHAEKLAVGLARFIWSRREAFVISLPSVDEALEQAMRIEGGPVVLAEGADGTMGGGPGDGTAILAGVLRRNIDVPVAAVVVDSVAVEQAIAAGIGSVVTLNVGGKLDPRFTRPVRISAKVKLISDGEFRYKGRAYTGRLVKMGRCVVLANGGISVLIAERSGPTTDPELYRSHGIEPKDMKLVLVKSPLGARLEYEPISKAFISVNSPGCCSPDLRTLPFERMPRPIFPFDPVEFSPIAVALTAANCRSK
jgi:microcystin degradation protein MlrC